LHPKIRIRLFVFHPTLLGIYTTFEYNSFNEKVYREKGFKAAMEKTIDDWSLKYPGIVNVDHIYLHSILSVSAETRRKYLEMAYLKGKDL
jgi:putative NADPH-quinone reductase